MYLICKGCDEGCKGCSKACDQMCKPLSKCMDRPLAGFVLMTFLLAGVGGLCGLGGAADATVGACTETPLMVFCLGNAFLGFCHMFFSCYVQSRLVTGLQQAQYATSKELMNVMWNLALYDVGFCIYVFIFIGSFFFNCMGLGWTDCGRQRIDTSLPLFSATLMILYALGCGAFCFLWTCMMWCDSCFGGSTSKPMPTQHTGMGRLVFGNVQPQRMAGGQAQQAPAYAQPVYAQPVPQQQAQQQPAAQQYGGQAPPPQQQQPGVAAQVFGGALGLIGAGFSKAGNKVGGQQPNQR